MIAGATSMVSAPAKEDQSSMQLASKLTGYEFYRKTLNSARHIVAPMVDQSELAWRLLSRRHGAQLCYTPMLNAKIFLQHTGYRAREFQTHPQDHPLIAQFCGNDPEIILEAAKMVQDKVEGVDLNLGCPQGIAKKGHYGAYLQDEWDLIQKIVNLLHCELSVPVTAKIRVFDDPQKTIKYAQMVETAGAQILTVHGRTREQRGEKTGLADWQQIKMVKEAVNIPVFANGNILFKDDIEKCLQATGADGVMTSEGNLYNPAIFKDEFHFAWDMVDEYLNICRSEAPSTSLTAVRGHLFKLYRPSLPSFPDHRIKLGVARSFDQISEIANEMNKMLKEKHSIADPAIQSLSPMNHSSSGINSPEWFCRSYIRDALLFNQVYNLDNCTSDSCNDVVDSEKNTTSIMDKQKRSSDLIDPNNANNSFPLTSDHEDGGGGGLEPELKLIKT